MSTIYPLGATGIMTGDIDLDDDTIGIAAVGPGYSYDPAHEVLSDLTDILGTPQDLTGTDVLTDGVFVAESMTYPGITAMETVRGLVLFKQTGSAGSSSLIVHISEYDDGTPINWPGTGGGMPILWDPAGIFQM